MAFTQKLVNQSLLLAFGFATLTDHMKTQILIIFMAIIVHLRLGIEKFYFV